MPPPGACQDQNAEGAGAKGAVKGAVVGGIAGDAGTGAAVGAVHDRRKGVFKKASGQNVKQFRQSITRALIGHTFCPSRLPCNSAAPKGSEVAWQAGPPNNPATAKIVPSRRPAFRSARVGSLPSGWVGPAHLTGRSRAHRNRELAAGENSGVWGASEYDSSNGGRQPGERLEASLG